ncbi:MAG: hypothetical protein M3R24_23595, partial [Chloroflexota bacterium]|nr:hypothetical protein [Chloroflexota bacterium]
IGGILMSLYVMKSAVETLITSMKTISASLGAASGLSGGGTFTKAAVGGLVGGAAGAALATMATGTSMATTGMAAYRGSGGNRRYAAAAALGRIQPVARLGEVAAMMGVQNEWTEGMYASRLAAKSKDGGTAFRRMRDLSAKDASKKVGGKDGATFAERAQQRDLVRQLKAQDPHDHPTAAAVKRLRAVGRGIGRMGDAVEGAVLRPGQAARTAGRALGKPLAPARRNLAGIRADGQSPYTPGGTARAAARAFARGSFTNRDMLGMVLTGKDDDAPETIKYVDRVPDSHIPSMAETERATPAQRAAWLRQGHHIQRNSDGTFTHWNKAEGLKEMAEQAALDRHEDPDEEGDSGDSSDASFYDERGNWRDGDAPAADTSRAVGVIQRARTASVARSLAHGQRSRSGAPRQRPRLMTSREREQRNAISSSLRDQQAMSAEAARRQAQRARTQSVLARGRQNSKHRTTHRAQPSIPRLGAARMWKHQLKQHIPNDPQS